MSNTAFCASGPDRPRMSRCCPSASVPALTYGCRSRVKLSNCVRCSSIAFCCPSIWNFAPFSAACALAVRGAGGTFGVGVGGSDGVSLHEQGCADLSHRAAQLEEDQHTCEHRVAGCIDSDGI